MHAELTDYHVFAAGGLGESVSVGIDLNELAAGHQALKTFGEVAAGIAVEAELPNQLLESGSALGEAFEFLQDGGIREHGGTETVLSSQLGYWKGARTALEWGEIAGSGRAGGGLINQFPQDDTGFAE